MNPKTPRSVRVLPDGTLELFDLEGVMGEIRDGVYVPAPSQHTPSMKQIETTTRPLQAVAQPKPKTGNRQPRTEQKEQDRDRLCARRLQPYISEHYAPRLNVRTGGVEVNGVALSRQEEKAFHQRMAQDGLLYSSCTETTIAVDAIAYRNRFDPVAEALAAVPTQMDRAQVLEWWTEILQLSEPWEAQLWLHWAIGAVEKLYRPGKLLKLCPVLVGGRDLRKSSFVRALAMGFGGTLILDQNERDKLISLKTQWIWEISEIEQLKKMGWDRAKDFLARPDDIYTPKNSNTAIVQPRNWCLIGTTNSAELVTDPNAASRLPCFTVHNVIDTERVEAEAPAMWAGVKALMDAGMTSDLTEGLNQELTLRQRDHQGENPLRDQIEGYLEETRKTEVALPELARFVLNVTESERYTKALARELQMAMGDLGWIKKPGRPWIPCPIKGHPHKTQATFYRAP